MKNEGLKMGRHNSLILMLVLFIICISLLISMASGQKGELRDSDGQNEGGELRDIDGQYEEAIASCDSALQIDPHNADAWFDKGITLKKMGKHSEGDRCIERAIYLIYE